MTAIKSVSYNIKYFKTPFDKSINESEILVEKLYLVAV